MESGVSRCKLVCTEPMNSKVPLYCTGNDIQYLVKNCNKKEHEKEYLYIYICITESLCSTAVINITL